MKLEPLPKTPMTRERFEALLLAVRDGVSGSLSEMWLEEIRDNVQHDAKVNDFRAVWHTAEVALGILRPGRYLPKREAVQDMRLMLAWIDQEDDTWTNID